MHSLRKFIVPRIRSHIGLKEVDAVQKVGAVIDFRIHVLQTVRVELVLAWVSRSGIHALIILHVTVIILDVIVCEGLLVVKAALLNRVV